METIASERVGFGVATGASLGEDTDGSPNVLRFFKEKGAELLRSRLEKRRQDLLDGRFADYCSETSYEDVVEATSLESETENASSSFVEATSTDSGRESDGGIRNEAETNDKREHNMTEDGDSERVCNTDKDTDCHTQMSVAMRRAETDSQVSHAGAAPISANDEYDEKYEANNRNRSEVRLVRPAALESPGDQFGNSRVSKVPCHTFAANDVEANVATLISDPTLPSQDEDEANVATQHTPMRSQGLKDPELGIPRDDAHSQSEDCPREVIESTLVNEGFLDKQAENTAGSDEDIVQATLTMNASMDEDIVEATLLDSQSSATEHEEAKAHVSPFVGRVSFKYDCDSQLSSSQYSELGSAQQRKLKTPSGMEKCYGKPSPRTEHSGTIVRSSEKRTPFTKITQKLLQVDSAKSSLQDTPYSATQKLDDSAFPRPKTQSTRKRDRPHSSVSNQFSGTPYSATQKIVQNALTPQTSCSTSSMKSKFSATPYTATQILSEANETDSLKSNCNSTTMPETQHLATQKLSMTTCIHSGNSAPGKRASVFSNDSVGDTPAKCRFIPGDTPQSSNGTSLNSVHKTLLRQSIGHTPVLARLGAIKSASTHVKPNHNPVFETPRPMGTSKPKEPVSCLIAPLTNGIGSDLSANVESLFTNGHGVRQVVSSATLERAYQLHRTSNADNEKLSRNVAQVASLFSTGSGKPVKISREKLARAERDTSEVVKSLFSTGKGKPVMISTEKLRNAKKEHDVVEKQGKPLYVADPKFGPKEEPTGQIVSLFSTGKGNPVSISKEKLRRAERAVDDMNPLAPFAKGDSASPSSSGKSPRMSGKQANRVSNTSSTNRNKPTTEKLQDTSDPVASLFSTGRGSSVRISKKAMENASCIQSASAVPGEFAMPKSAVQHRRKKPGKFVTPRSLQHPRTNAAPTTVSTNADTVRIQSWQTAQSPIAEQFGPKKLRFNSPQLPKGFGIVKTGKKGLSLLGPLPKKTVQQVVEFALDCGVPNFLVSDVRSTNAIDVMFERSTGNPLYLASRKHDTNETSVGWMELRHEFIETTNADSALASEPWFANHFRWIVWKLACTYRIFPHKVGAHYFTKFTVLEQMAYRYEREIEKAERPILRRMLEGDINSATHMVLCISAVISKDRIVVTDGWYAVEASLDASLFSLVLSEHRGLTVGAKLHVCGASLVGHGSGISPLECNANLNPHFPEDPMKRNLATAQPCLCLTRNCTKPARWDAKLGMQRERFFQKPFRSIIHSGGTIPWIRGIIYRKFDVMYCENIAVGDNIERNWLTEAQNADREARYQTGLSESKARIWNDLRTQYEISGKPFSNASIITEVEEMMTKDPGVPKPRDVRPCVQFRLLGLCNQQNGSKGTRDDMSSTNIASPMNSTSRDGTCFNCGGHGHWASQCDSNSRSSATDLKKQNHVRDFEHQVDVTVWGPSMEMIREIKEGMLYDGYLLRFVSEWRHTSEPLRILRLSNTRSSRWCISKQAPSCEMLERAGYVPRRVTSFVEADKLGHEYDFVGVVVLNNNSKPMENIQKSPTGFRCHTYLVDLTSRGEIIMALSMTCTGNDYTSELVGIKQNTVLALRDIRFMHVDASTGFLAADYCRTSSFCSHGPKLSREGWSHLRQRFEETRDWVDSEQGRLHLETVSRDIGTGLINGFSAPMQSAYTKPKSPATSTKNQQAQNLSMQKLVVNPLADPQLPSVNLHSMKAKMTKEERLALQKDRKRKWLEKYKPSNVAGRSPGRVVHSSSPKRVKMSETFQFSTKYEHLTSIMLGKKLIEARLNKGPVSRIRPGDRILFKCGELGQQDCRVVTCIPYHSFRHLLQYENIRLLFPIMVDNYHRNGIGSPKKEEEAIKQELELLALEKLKTTLYSHHQDDDERFGVVAIHIQCLEK